MTKFNIKRFDKVLIWSAKMTKKEMLTITAAMAFAMFVPFIMHLISSYGFGERSTASNLHAASQFAIAIFAIVIMTGGCWIFNNMKTKEQRTTFRMLPATDLEKFVARALYATVVWWFMSFVAYCLADGLRVIASLAAGIHVVKSTIPDLVSTLTDTFNPATFTLNGTRGGEVYATAALALAWTFWAHSFYVLGGTLFRRRQFVLTTLAHFVLMLVGTAIIVDSVDGVSHDTLRRWGPTWTGIAATVFALWGVADWILSYKIFCRMQVINNKWVNIKY